MIAVRQFHMVENGVITIELPADFPTGEVEVIVLSKQPAPPVEVTPLDEGQAAIQQFLTLDTSHFTPQQLAAYQRTCALLRKGRKPDEPRILDLYAGLVEAPEGFDAPLPDDIVDLFYGSETDEYGITYLDPGNFAPLSPRSL